MRAPTSQDKAQVKGVGNRGSASQACVVGEVCQKLAGYLGLRHSVERRSDRRQGGAVTPRDAKIVALTTFTEMPGEITSLGRT
jgi:hypothetical protein